MKISHKLYVVLLKWNSGTFLACSTSQTLLELCLKPFLQFTREKQGAENKQCPETCNSELWQLR